MTPTDALFDQRYRALASRDARFDGQFIAGVHSTGIYCRPSCPASTPHARNVSFYRTAAAAHEAGLRACKRCQPDAVPGSPEWNASDELASRAMRLIADGLVEREGVTGLAGALGYTPRHLTRVLRGELGAGPLALARAHRAQTARTLLAATELTVADVAFASGFSSIRQFNDTIRDLYETTPLQLRALARRGGRAPESSTGTAIALRLPARTPFDGAGVMAHLATHLIPGTETLESGVYRRRLRLPGGVAELAIGLDGSAGVAVEATLHRIGDLSALVARVRRMFDLDADSIAIDEALSADAALAALVRARPGVRIPGAADPEEALFRTLLGQQVTIGAGNTAAGRLYAGLLELGQTEPGLFPRAAAIAEHGRDFLRGPQRRIEAIVGTARALAEGSLTLSFADSRQELTAKLISMPGIGAWTAGYLAMRVLGNPDVLLHTDLVLRRSALALGLPGGPRGLLDHAQRWAPWRSYATLHLWRARPLRATPSTERGGRT